VLRLIIAIVAGLVIAVVAVGVTENLLANAANGTPSSSSLYVYGSR
jgi:K+-transporting ATPase c subunit